MIEGEIVTYTILVTSVSVSSIFSHFSSGNCYGGVDRRSLQMDESYCEDGDDECDLEFVGGLDEGWDDGRI